MADRGEAALLLAAGIVFGPQLMTWGKPAYTTALRIARFINLSDEPHTIDKFNFLGHVVSTLS